MEKHSLWQTIVTVLANLVSKFVKRSRLVIRDEQNGGYIAVSVTYPYVIQSANASNKGKFNIVVGKEEVHEENVQD